MNSTTSVGDALGGELDVQDDLLTVRKFAEPVAVGVDHAKLVEHRLRALAGSNSVPTLAKLSSANSMNAGVGENPLY